jgi:AcrR family transcriptional regulator
MPGLAEKPLRRDAERNRQRILAAARELFAERGLEVTLDDIAHAAGVGVGTVYRRFPDKDELIEALFEVRIGEVVDAAHEALEVADPWDAYVGFLTRALELQASDRGLKEVLLGSARGRERVESAREKIQPAAVTLLRRAQLAGVVRDDLDIADVVLLQFAISEVANLSRREDPHAWRRLLTVFLDGLRPDRRRSSPMPVAPMDQEELLRSVATIGASKRRPIGR